MSPDDVKHADSCPVPGVANANERNGHMAFQYDDTTGELIGISCMPCGGLLGTQPLVGRLIED